MVAGASSPGPSRSKDQYRSHSLPLGSQLNADWSVSTAAPAPAPPPPPLLHEPAKHTGRVSWLRFCALLRGFAYTLVHT